MEKFIASLLLIIFFVGPGYAGDWGQFRKDNEHSAQIEEAFEPPLSLKWTYETDDKIVSSPAVVGDTLFVGSRDKKMYAINASSGEKIWEREVGNWIDSSPYVDNNKVIFSSRDGNLYCLNSSDGSIMWTFKTGGTDSSSPIIDDGIVYVGSGFPNAFVYAVNAGTGKEIWRRDTSQMVYSSGAVDDDSVFIGSNGGIVFSLNKGTGAVEWKFKVNGGLSYSSPLLWNNTVYIAAGDFDWNIYAINAGTGQSLWVYEIEDIQNSPTYVSSPAMGNDSLFVVSGYSTQYLYSLSLIDGSLQWKAELGQSTRYGFSSSPVVTQGTVYVVSASGIIKAFHLADGQLFWEYDLGAKVLSSPVIANDMFYVGTFDGTLYAFE